MFEGFNSHPVPLRHLLHGHVPPRDPRPPHQTRRHMPPSPEVLLDELPGCQPPLASLDVRRCHAFKSGPDERVRVDLKRDRLVDLLEVSQVLMYSVVWLAVGTPPTWDASKNLNILAGHPCISTLRLPLLVRAVACEGIAEDQSTGFCREP